MSLITTTNHRKGPRRFQKETVLEIAEKTKRKQTVQCKRMILLKVVCVGLAYFFRRVLNDKSFVAFGKPFLRRFSHEWA